jgi:ankyrin repeat protein
MLRISDSQLQEHGYLNNQEVYKVLSLSHPLLEAATHGRPDICSLFLSQKQFPPLFLHQALSAAAGAGHLAVVELLFRTEPAVSTPDMGADSILCQAAKSGSLQLVQFLLANGADVNNTPGTPWSKQGQSELHASKCFTPVVAAAVGGSPAVLQLLVDRGAALESCWHEALSGAAGHGRLEATRLLLQLAGIVPSSSTEPGADAGAKQARLSLKQEVSSTSPLCSAAFFRHRDVVQLLLECGHNFGSKNGALLTAVRNGDLPIMQALIAHGADVDQMYGGWGSHSLWVSHTRPVEAAIQCGSLAALQLLVQSGARIQKSDLAAAARYGKDLGILQFLMDLGLQDEDDACLLAAAASYEQYWPIVQLLLESGAGGGSSNADGKQQTSLSARLGKALVAAAKMGKVAIMERLLDYHVHPDLDQIPCASGSTPCTGETCQGVTGKHPSCPAGAGMEASQKALPGHTGRVDISKEDLTQALCNLDADLAGDRARRQRGKCCYGDTTLKRFGLVRDLLIQRGADGRQSDRLYSLPWYCW